eukprot:gene13967-19909_t
MPRSDATHEVTTCPTGATSRMQSMRYCRPLTASFYEDEREEEEEDEDVIDNSAQCADHDEVASSSGGYGTVRMNNGAQCADYDEVASSSGGYGTVRMNNGYLEQQPSEIKHFLWNCHNLKASPAQSPFPAWTDPPFALSQHPGNRIFSGPYILFE